MSGRARLRGAARAAAVALAVIATPVVVLVMATVGPAAAAPATESTAPHGVQVRVDEPRAFGHHTGDVVQRRVALTLPAGWVLDESTLPEAGRRGRSFELRRVGWQAPGVGVGWRGWGGPGPRQAVLTLDYQVFVAPADVKVLELPPIKLRFTGGPRPEELRIDAWPLVVAPLGPAEASPRNGLGELRPAAAPPLIDTSAPLQRLRWWAALALPLALYLAWVHGAMPWWSRRHRPFGRALAVLAALPPGDPQAQAMAFRSVHQALNDSHGRVVFGHGLDDFLQAQPRFAPLRDRLVSFFERSQAQFFQVTDPATRTTSHGDDTLAWLRRLCRDARDIERGSA